jgi:hypothetical protein
MCVHRLQICHEFDQHWRDFFEYSDLYLKQIKKSISPLEVFISLTQSLPNMTLRSLTGFIALVFYLLSTMPKSKGYRGEQARRQKAFKADLEKDSSSSISISSSSIFSSSSSNSSSNSSSSSSGNSCNSSSCRSGCGHHHNFEPLDDEADILQQENCDYDGDNETSDEWKAFLAIVVDEVLFALYEWLPSMPFWTST